MAQVIHTALHHFPLPVYFCLLMLVGIGCPTIGDFEKNP
jgi:hypothetical protein